VGENITFSREGSWEKILRSLTTAGGCTTKIKVDTPAKYKSGLTAVLF
jgi:hypothetical protein